MKNLVNTFGKLLVGTVVAFILVCVISLALNVVALGIILN